VKFWIRGTELPLMELVDVETPQQKNDPELSPEIAKNH
jgi:hypothetical protein